MTLAKAKRYAMSLVDWLAPYCERIEIAGSIARERPVCNDVDLVCISKVEESRDLFGNVVSWKPLLHEFLREYVEKSLGRSKWIHGGGQYNLFLQLPKCQLDIWCTQQSNWGSVLICRTGSKEHNIWLAQRAERLGTKWDPYRGVSGTPATTEAEVYAALGLPWITPKEREMPGLAQKFDRTTRDHKTTDQGTKGPRD